MRILTGIQPSGTPHLGNYFGAVYYKVERFNGFGHSAVVLLNVELLGLEHTHLHALLAQQFYERLVLGKRLVAAEERKVTFGNLVLVA